MKQPSLCLLAAFAALSLFAPARADEVVVAPPTTPGPTVTVVWPEAGQLCEKTDKACGDLAARNPFLAGALSVQFLSGYSVGLGGKADEPSLDYTPQSLRIGTMLTAPEDCCPAWYQGNVELLLDLNYGRMVKDWGEYVAGTAGLLRYNFVQPHCLVVPYVQAGAGVAFTDVSKAPQNLIRDEVNGLFRADIGARLMFTEALSLDLEVGVSHLGAFGRSDRGDGANNVSFGLGLTYSFGKR